MPAPPPVAARFASTTSSSAEAYIYVVGDVGAPRRTTRGTDRTHVLVWASRDVGAGTRAADYLGGPLTAGYHLRRFEPVAGVGQAQAQLIERCVASGALRRRASPARVSAA